MLVAKQSREMTRVALMAVLITLCAWLSIPAPLPFTLQTFGIFCALLLLGPRRGAAAIALYLCMGLVGLPVFAGFSGGVGQLLGASGGYLLGFLPLAGVYALVKKLRGSDGLALALGLAVCYAFGTAWYALVYAKAGVMSALALCEP